MNCEKYQSELEDLLYGELAETSAAQVRAHLAACPACAAKRSELEREQEIFTQFYEQSALDPSAEMWDAIRSRIAVEPAPEAELTGSTASTKRWLKGLLSGGALSWLLNPAVVRQAAFALVLIALSVAITTMVLRRERNEERNTAQNRETPALQSTSTPQPNLTPTPQSDATSTPAPMPGPTPGPTPGIMVAENNRSTIKTTPAVKPSPAPVRPLTDQEKLNQQLARAEREYQNAIKMLDTAIAKRKDLLDPELIKQYENSLALIDSSIAASRRALRERPDDPSAGQFLLASYARKVELMQDIAMR